MGRWFVLALLTAACGRVSFDRIGDAGAGDSTGAAGSLVDNVLTAGETSLLAIGRTTPGSYYEASGRLVYAAPQEPRFDHDPSTHAPRGLLIEAAAVNYTHHSEQLDDGVEWFANGTMSVLANLAMAPDDTLSAEELNDTDTVIQSRRANSHLITDDTRPYTCSGFVKAGTRSKMSFGCELLGGTSQLQASITVDLAAGTITNVPTDQIGYGIERIGNGWFRVWVAVQNNGSGNDSCILSFFSERMNDATTGTFLAWGAQLEVGAQPSSYFPNPTLGIVTRAGDQASLMIPPAQLQQGSLRVVARPIYDTFIPVACLLGVGAQRVCIERVSMPGDLRVDVVGSATLTLAQGAWPAGVTRWAAITYDETSVEAVTDLGANGGSYTLTTAITQLVLGRDTAEEGNVHLERVTVWPTRLTAAELSALSP